MSITENVSISNTPKGTVKPRLLSSEVVTTNNYNTFNTSTLQQLDASWKNSVNQVCTKWVNQPVRLEIEKHPSGAYDRIFVTIRQLRVYWCVGLSLTRGRVCRLKLLLVLASAVILGSESRGTHGSYFTVSVVRLPQPGGPGPCPAKRIPG
jgi:hypothetical protein